MENFPSHPRRLRRLDHELYSQSDRITFVTIRAVPEKSPFQNPGIAKMVLEMLEQEQQKSRCWIYTYCLMPDHLHFLIQPQDNNSSVLGFVRSFKGRTTNQSWQLGWRGKLWQERYYDHIIRSEESLEQISQYILQNPERKELVRFGAQSPWMGKFHNLMDFFDRSDPKKS